MLQAAPKLVVAEVLSVEDHPKADRLKVCEVDNGVAMFKVRTALWAGGREGGAQTVRDKGTARALVVGS